jgi:predicted nucleotidyltransferase
MRLQTPLDDVFRSPSYVRVLRALHHLPAGLPASAREIARRAGVSHPTASQALASLAEQGVVARTRAPRASAFELRRTHTVVEKLTPLFDWEEGLQGELVALLRAEIQRRAPGTVTRAYLFGSAVEGGMTPMSDVDVAVLHAAGAGESVTAAMQEIGERVRERFGNRLSFILAAAPPDELQSSRRKGFRLLRQILRDGVPILESQRDPSDG